jgi:hypothetical protein
MKYTFEIADKTYDILEKPQGINYKKRDHMMPLGTGLRETTKNKERIGKHCFICRNPKLLGQLAQDFQVNRKIEDLCVKVFYIHHPVPEDKTLEEWCIWGNPNRKIINGYSIKRGNMLTEASTIQNIGAQHGLAPYIYGLFLTNYGGVQRPCQFCEYVDGPHATWEEVIKAKNQARQLGQKFKFTCDQEMIGVFDIKNNKILDWQIYYFIDEITKNKPWGEAIKL